MSSCLLCDVDQADAFFQRRRVWVSQWWRLSVVLRGALPGFSHLEPNRHIPFVHDLDGPEAATVGSALAYSARVLKQATGADKVYVYVFGDRVPHLHFNLAPHHEGGPLVGGRGLLSPGTPDAAPAEHEAIAAALEAAVQASPADDGGEQAGPQ